MLEKGAKISRIMATCLLAVSFASFSISEASFS